MRLLNVETFQLEEFFYDDPPPYAILSHTWGKDSEEVSHRDVLDGKLSHGSTRPSKVSGCCAQAKKDGFRYVWIDTCCIDKTNSTELHEAINSMFRWYQNAAICYAFLSDVPARTDPRKPGSAFLSSRWFQRGWTLQELLAPLNFRFYDARWQCMGTKGALCDAVEQITGIPTPYLLGIADFRQASVAQRMCWAAPRSTKRQEDMAYCLLGIFGIFMPLIYGEGDKAFRRLQEQIMKDGADDSIFAWDLPPVESADRPGRGIPGVALAPGPSHFRNSGGVVSAGHSAQSFEQHGGRLRLSVTLDTAPGGQLHGVLSCGLEQEPDKMVGIPLIAAPGGQPDHYVRQEGRPAVLLQTSEMGGAAATIIHLQLDGGRQSPIVGGAQSCWFQIRNSHPGVELVEVFPPECWHKERALIEAGIEPDTGDAQVILARFRDKQPGLMDFVAVLEAKPQAQPRCRLMVATSNTALADISHHLDTRSDGVSAPQAANNGASDLSMELEMLCSSPSQRRFAVKPVALSEPPAFTLDATAGIWTSGVESVLADLRQIEKARTQQAVIAKSQLPAHRSKMSQAQGRLDAVRAQIRALMEEERKLDDEYKHLCGHEHQLVLAQSRAMQETDDASKTISAMHCLLDSYDTEFSIERFNARAEAEEQILPFAVEKEYRGFVRLLLNNGISVMGEDLVGRTALHHAAWIGDEPLVRTLISIDAAVDATARKMGCVTPLHMAVQRGWPGIVQLLLDCEADVNMRTVAGSTALHFAAARGLEDIAMLLIERGADLAAVDKDGKTPAQLAQDHGKHALAELISGRGRPFPAANQTREKLQTPNKRAPPRTTAERGETCAVGERSGHQTPAKRKAWFSMPLRTGRP